MKTKISKAAEEPARHGFIANHKALCIQPTSFKMALTNCYFKTSSIIPLPLNVIPYFKSIYKREIYFVHLIYHASCSHKDEPRK